MASEPEADEGVRRHLARQALLARVEHDMYAGSATRQAFERLDEEERVEAEARELAERVQRAERIRRRALEIL